MKPNAISSAVGALKLVPMFLNHPSIISRATLIGATTEAVQLLEALSEPAIDLAEVFHCVNAVIRAEYIAYVTPVKCPQYPYGAVIADADGNVLAAVKGKSKEGLAELIRLKLLPPNDKHGETAT